MPDTFAAQVAGLRGPGLTDVDRAYVDSKANAAVLTFGDVLPFSEPALQRLSGAQPMPSQPEWGVLIPAGQSGATSIIQARFRLTETPDNGDQLVLSMVLATSTPFTRFDNFAAFLQIRRTDNSVITPSPEQAVVSVSNVAGDRVITFTYTTVGNELELMPVAQMLNTAATTVAESIYLRQLTLRQPSDANGLQTGTDRAFAFLTAKTLEKAQDQAVSLLASDYTVTLTVKPTGGDFTHPKLALDSITDAGPTKRYKIEVYPGTYAEYAEWHPKDYVDIEGNGRKDQQIITYENPDNASAATIQNTSTMWLDSITTLKNLTIRIKNGRYAIHRETNGQRTGIKSRIINCVVEHLGNASATNGSAWPIDSQYGVGAGNSPGEIYEDRGSVFRGPGAGFSFHNSNAGAYTIGSTVDLEGCRFEATASGRPDIRVKNVSPGAGDRVRLVGNTLAKLDYGDAEWPAVTPGDMTSDRAVFAIDGYGNTAFTFVNSITGGAAGGPAYQPLLTGA